MKSIHGSYRHDLPISARPLFPFDSFRNWMRSLLYRFHQPVLRLQKGLCPPVQALSSLIRRSISKWSRICFPSRTVIRTALRDKIGVHWLHQLVFNIVSPPVYVLVPLFSDVLCCIVSQHHDVLIFKLSSSWNSSVTFHVPPTSIPQLTLYSRLRANFRYHGFVIDLSFFY